MRQSLLLFISLVLSACASAPPADPASALLRDERFAPPTVAIDRAQIFALDDRMRAYLESDIGALLRRKGVQRGLIEALYERGLLQIDYDSSMTRNAAQAFEARAGNCLSLVVLTAAFAKELGVKVQFQSAYADETWARSGSLVFRSGHVNITLGRRLAEFSAARLETTYTVDFLPASELQGLRTREIREDTVVAMFFNNRAAEALGSGEVDNAYWWSRAAIGADPAFMSAVNTLGVVYLQRGEAAAAERAFAHVLANEPDNTRAMSNLIVALRQAHRDAEAAVWQQRLTQLEPAPPFHWFDLGRAALERGDAAEARALFAREVERMPYHHEFLYWLAVADYRLGDIGMAQRHLARAQEHSTNARDRGLYSAKLNWLRDQRTQ